MSLSPRPGAPPCEPQPPICSLCGNETTADDGLYDCAACAVSWPCDDLNAGGTWEDPDAPQCTSVDGRFLDGGHYAYGHRRPEDRTTLLRCMRAQDHTDDEHVWSNSWSRRAWRADGAATPEQLAAVELLLQATV